MDWLSGGLGVLGIGGDVFNAYSQMQQQQRMRDLYKQQNDPQYVMGKANQYYNTNLANLRSALPQLERTSINPEIGQRGISGGAAQSLYDQTVAQYQQQAWQNALAQASGGLQGAGQMIGQPTGQGGGTANWLQYMMLQQALQGRSQPQQGMASMDPVYGSTGNAGSPYASYQGQAASLALSLQPNMMSGGNLDPLAGFF